MVYIYSMINLVCFVQGLGGQEILPQEAIQIVTQQQQQQQPQQLQPLPQPQQQITVQEVAQPQQQVVQETVQTQQPVQQYVTQQITQLSDGSFFVEPAPPWLQVTKFKWKCCLAIDRFTDWKNHSVFKNSRDV